MIQTVCRLAHHGTHHLTIRFDHLKLHGLIGKRFTVAVTQQSIYDHRFTRAVEIARTKHKELLAVTRITGNRKFRQIEGRKLQVEQVSRRLYAPESAPLLCPWSAWHALRIAGRLRQRLAFIVQQDNVDARLRRTVFQALGENIQPIMVTVSGQANITQRKEGSRIAIAIVPRLVHHGDIDAGLLQGFDFPQRKQSFSRVLRAGLRSNRPV
jgi:hypothetical protein